MKELPISAPEQIIQLIPQRSPMVMVDTLWEYTPETAVVGLTITQENIFVQEGNLSASGLIEHMAQSIALHKGYGYYLKALPTPMGYIGAIKHIEIQALPKKGEAIRTHITILQEYGNLHTRYLYSPRGNENRSGEVVTFFLQMPYHLG